MAILFSGPDPFMLFCRPCYGGVHTAYKTGLYPAIFWKRPLDKNGKKMIDLRSKLGKFNDIKGNNGSKIYPQNQGFF